MMQGTKDRQYRWWAGTAFGVMAFIVVLAGIASACTSWKGKMDVKGSGGAGTVTATGNKSTMGY
ncbi:MAG: hypothetical protein ACRDZ4_00630, partial [Egibacteraceae bacterium]